MLSVNEHGGRVSVRGKGNNETRAVMGFNEYGNGGYPLGIRTAIVWQL